MLAFVTLGTNDHPRACVFYDALMASIGLGRALDGNKLVAFARG